MQGRAWRLDIPGVSACSAEQLQPFYRAQAGDSLFLSVTSTIEDSSNLNALHQLCYSLIRRTWFSTEIYIQRDFADTIILKAKGTFKVGEVSFLFLQNNWVYSYCTLNTGWHLNSSQNSPRRLRCGKLQAALGSWGTNMSPAHRLSQSNACMKAHLGTSLLLLESTYTFGKRWGKPVMLLSHLRKAGPFWGVYSSSRKTNSPVQRKVSYHLPTPAESGDADSNIQTHFLCSLPFLVNSSTWRDVVFTLTRLLTKSPCAGRDHYKHEFGLSSDACWNSPLPQHLPQFHLVSYKQRFILSFTNPPCCSPSSALI